MMAAKATSEMMVTVVLRRFTTVRASETSSLRGETPCTKPPNTVPKNSIRPALPIHANEKAVPGACMGKAMRDTNVDFKKALMGGKSGPESKINNKMKAYTAQALSVWLAV